MYLLPAILPFIAFICVFVLLGNRYTFANTRQVLLYTALAVGAYLVGLTEVLSLWNGVTLLGLAIGWIIPSLISFLWAWRQVRRGGKVLLPRVRFPSTWDDWVKLLVVASIAGITLFIAWTAPPQTKDAMSYHMSRVAHWAQDASVRNFATGISRQVSMSPGAEMEVLNLYVLGASDRLANIPQWLAMAGSLVAVSLAAYYLGAKSTGQWIAAAFTAALPIGIVEASSANTDYVTGFWVICAAVESLEYYRTRQARSLVFLSLSAGLAILAKPIAIPYLIPFGAFAGYLLLRQAGVWATLKWAAAAVVIVLVLNAGFLARNWITYGSPLRTKDVEEHYNEVHTPAAVISILLRNAAWHAGLPHNAKWNKAIYRDITAAHVLLGIDLNDPRTTNIGEFRVDSPSTSESFATNPYQAYLILACFVLAFFLYKRIGKLAVIYSLLAASTFVIFSFIFKWNVFGGRYHLPFFVLYAPAAGVVLGSLDRFKTGTVVAVLLCAGSFPWLFSIDSRPILPVEGQSLVGSILTTPREELYFANTLYAYDGYKKIFNDIQSQGCSQVGLRIGGDDQEYFIWHMMGAPRPGLTIEWSVNGPTERYRLPNFQACALICKGCSAAEKELDGLHYAYTMGLLDLEVYLPPGK